MSTNITLTEKIADAIKENERNLAQCDTEIAVINARKACIEDTLLTLNVLLNDAKRSENVPTATDEKPSKPVKKRKSAADTSSVGKTATPSTTAAAQMPEAVNDPSSDSAAHVTMKEIAEKAHTTTSVIAGICNDLGFNDEISKNGYRLTDLQVDAVMTRFNESGTIYSVSPND